MRVFVLYILTICLLSGFILDTTEKQEDKKHPVTVNHPAFKKGDPNQFYLKEYQPDGTKPAGYLLEVESVICFDHICKIVPVRIFWNFLGTYQKYELAEGVILEKKKGEPFTSEDYKRLDEILRDKKSPFKDISYFDITHERVHGEGDVDAVSGPTPILIDEAKTIAGAAWTCFTLWHWANGDIVQEVQRISGAASSLSDLQLHIESGKPDQQLFALHELIRRKDSTHSIVPSVVNQASHEDQQTQFVKQALIYLAQTEAETYYPSLEKLLETPSAERRMMYWNSLLKYKETAQEGYFDKFCTKVLEANNYPEINLFLTTLERKKATTPALIKEMIPLLQQEYSIINRRIYWHLSEQDLSPDQAQVLQSYFDKYSDNL